ncbi:unnamed protein product [Brassicogethes aeneus]|uniref:Zinc finger PHD-type domain-containing protein n=1 Tax=Brassicogethes aeneus TaxID=1431903 RepID=A0A9P0BCU6_BRAAE|nr:unnamed protein product [Brassicogethes aeneus]
MAAGNSSVPTITEKKCAKCKRKAVNGIECATCKSLVHINCTNISDDTPIKDYKCILCEEKKSEVMLVTTEKTAYQDDAETQGRLLNETLKENEILLRENELLKKLIKELEEKQDLLYFKINTLEGCSAVSAGTLEGSSVIIAQNSKNNNIKQKKTQKPNEKNTVGNNNVGNTAPSSSNVPLQNDSQDNPKNYQNSEWKTVSHKGNKNGQKNKNVIIGTSEDTNLKVADKSAWLYVGRLHQEMTPTELCDHLKKSFQNENFTVEEIKKHENNHSINKSFKMLTKSKMANRGCCWRCN